MGSKKPTSPRPSAGAGWVFGGIRSHSVHGLTQRTRRSQRSEERAAPPSLASGRGAGERELTEPSLCWPLRTSRSWREQVPVRRPALDACHRWLGITGRNVPNDWHSGCGCDRRRLRSATAPRRGSGQFRQPDQACRIRWWSGTPWAVDLERAMFRTIARCWPSRAGPTVVWVKSKRRVERAAGCGQRPNRDQSVSSTSSASSDSAAGASETSRTLSRVSVPLAPEPASVKNSICRYALLVLS